MRNTEAQYRAEWAAKTGKSEREIYVPEALCEPVRLSLDELRAALAADLGTGFSITQTFEEFILGAVQGGLDRRG